MLSFTLCDSGTPSGEHKSWLHTMTTTSHVCRQPFVVIWSIAAVAWDAANASVKTGSAAGTADEHRSHCKLAVDMIDAEITALMEKTTIFTFATSFHETMGRYVYLRRALQGRTSIDEVSPFLPCFVSKFVAMHCDLFRRIHSMLECRCSSNSKYSLQCCQDATHLCSIVVV